MLRLLDGQIFSAEMVGKPKPHPEVYLLALNTLGITAEETLVVEDSPTGVQAAKAAGLRVVGFLGAAHIHPGHDIRLLEAGADFLAPEAAALARLLTELGVL